MPTFEYKCKDCGHVTEFLEERDSEGQHKCEECKSRDTERMLSTFAVQVKAPAAGPSCDQCPSTGSCPYA